MSNNKLAKLLTDTLPSGLPNLFNPWRERCTDDEPCNGPDAKLASLSHSVSDLFKARKVGAIGVLTSRVGSPRSSCSRKSLRHRF